jgi:hypothetical protein
MRTKNLAVPAVSQTQQRTKGAAPSGGHANLTSSGTGGGFENPRSEAMTFKSPSSSVGEKPFLWSLCGNAIMSVENARATALAHLIP